MDNREALSVRILGLSKGEKLLLLASVILELTFAARSVFSENEFDGAGMLSQVQKMNSVCGYLIKVIEDATLDSEILLAQMVAQVMEENPSRGMLRLKETM